MLRMPTLTLDVLLSSSRLLLLAEQTIAEHDRGVMVVREEAVAHTGFMRRADGWFAHVEAMG